MGRRQCVGCVSLCHVCGGGEGRRCVCVCVCFTKVWPWKRKQGTCTHTQKRRRTWLDVYLRSSRALMSAFSTAANAAASAACLFAAASAAFFADAACTPRERHARTHTHTIRDTRNHSQRAIRHPKWLGENTHTTRHDTHLGSQGGVCGGNVSQLCLHTRQVSCKFSPLGH